MTPQELHVTLLEYYQSWVKQYGSLRALALIQKMVKEKYLPAYERNARDPAVRKLKGELAETLLEIYLLYLQQAIQPSCILKSLCIQFKTGNQKTTEMDLLFVTPKCIFMFECKAYQGGQHITGECSISSSSGKPMNVYAQSEIHRNALMQYINPYLNKELAVKAKQVPYKMILFELSSRPLIDDRTLEWKTKIPCMSSESFIRDFGALYKTFQYDLFNYNYVESTLKRLNSTSASNFRKHMKGKK